MFFGCFYYILLNFWWILRYVLLVLRCCLLYFIDFCGFCYILSDFDVILLFLLDFSVWGGLFWCLICLCFVMVVLGIFAILDLFFGFGFDWLLIWWVWGWYKTEILRICGFVFDCLYYCLSRVRVCGFGCICIWTFTFSFVGCLFLLFLVYDNGLMFALGFELWWFDWCALGVGCLYVCELCLAGLFGVAYCIVFCRIVCFRFKVGLVVVGV